MKRHDLSRAQAQALHEVDARLRRAMHEWNTAVTLVGLDPASVRGGELVNDPHLLVEGDAVSA